MSYLWDGFIKKDSKILELEVDFVFNDLALAFNDFQYIMPSSVNKLLFDPVEYQTKCDLILANIKKGNIMCSSENYDLIQSHLPYIKKLDIKSSIYAQSNNEIKLNESSLYTVLIRLEKIGYIKSDWENTGSYPRRKYYNITKSGEDFLQDNLQDYFKINDLLCKLNK